jgi:hypothetical protein
MMIGSGALSVNGSITGVGGTVTVNSTATLGGEGSIERAMDPNAAAGLRVYSRHRMRAAARALRRPSIVSFHRRLPKSHRSRRPCRLVYGRDSDKSFNGVMRTPPKHNGRS